MGHYRKEAPHLRLLQRTLANDITSRVHGKEELEKAVAASEILFGKATKETLGELNEVTFLQVFEGVQKAQLSRLLLDSGISIVDLLVTHGQFLSSNSEARRELKANAIMVNKERIDENFLLTGKHLLNDKYVLIGKGKKTNYLVVFS